MRRDKNKKRGKKFGNQNKLSLFKKPEIRFKRSCPLSIKGAPEIDYKNIKLLRKYVTESNKILSSRITGVSLGKQKKLAKEIINAQILCLL